MARPHSSSRRAPQQAPHLSRHPSLRGRAGAPRQSAPVPVGVPVSPAASSRASGTGRRPARTVAGVLLVLLAVVALALSALSMFNWSAQRSYESASARLRGNVAAARSGSRTTADIQASQQQVDADLADLSSSSAVQVGPISTAVGTASATSRRLDRVLALMAKGKSWSQATKEAEKKAAKAGVRGSGSSQQKPSGAQSSGGGTQDARSDEQQAKEQEEQKKKLDRLISRTQSSTDSTTKPW